VQQAAPSRSEIRSVLAAFRRRALDLEQPSVNQLAGPQPDPFRILISTMISLRTRDEVTLAASKRLFAQVSDPAGLASIETSRLESLIFPAGFYRVKAAALKKTAAILLGTHAGKVPDRLEELLALPGVGRKTANLVLGLAFGRPAICVDTHVHRISNRLGWVRTSRPDDTEIALAAILPKSCWIELNALMVAYGRKVCTPTAPHRPDCGARTWCARSRLRP
jgi:endonuclease III